MTKVLQVIHFPAYEDDPTKNLNLVKAVNAKC